MTKKQIISEQEWTRIRIAAVVKQIVDRGIRDEKVLKAMREVPRHLFLPENVPSALAYADRPLPIGGGQTISQPYIVAYITEKLGLTGKEFVLEIGAGSGYQAAVLAHLAKEIISIEYDPNLAHFAQSNLEAMKIKNVEIKTADGSGGWMEDAPYDRIVLSAAIEEIPEILLTQLSCPGKLIAPIGGKTRQMLTLFEKQPDPSGGAPRLTRKPLIPVVFVPMRGDAEKSKI